MNREGRKLNKKIMLAVLISACLLMPSTAGQLGASVKGNSDVAPDFALTDIDGNVFSLSDYRGKVVLLDFCGTWCAPCVQEISHLKCLYEEFGEKLVIISISPEDEEVLRDFRDEYGIVWIVARDTTNVFDTYGIYYIPTLVTIDQEGYIRYTHVGLTEESILRSEIESLLPKTIYVDDDNTAGPWDGTKEHPYQNITSGLEHASAGDTIFVRAGTYNESIVVGEAISLVGESQKSVITGPKGYNPIIHITANKVSIMGFTVQNPKGYPGIQLINVESCTVSGNKVNVYPIGGYGIVLRDTSKSLIERNVVNDTHIGIVMEDSSSCIFSENTVSSCNNEIYMLRSSNNEVIHNNFIDTDIWLYVSGSYSNSWDNGYPSGGNYWSDYKDRYPDATEIDGSGIWDTPYVIDDYNQDNYPLMEPWTPTPPIPTTIDELKTEIEELGQQGKIDNGGIVKSLFAKLNVAQKLVDKGKIAEAKSILEEDFIPQVQNLSGIHITPEAAELLIESAEYLISHL